MNEQERHNLFAELINRHQSELYGYIYAVVRNWEDTDDLYQSVCLETISKGSFLPITIRNPKKGATDGQAKEAS